MTTPVSGHMTATLAGILLTLTVFPGKSFSAQRPEGNVPSIEPDAERTTSQTSSFQRQALELAQLDIDAGHLGKQARSAVRQWPAAQKADPAWEWARVLVFLVQTALVAKGYDPGRPDGVMGPNTMMALVAWHAKSGKPMEIGIAAAVAYLLHATLEEKGLEPGPREEILGSRSEAALERWADAFSAGAVTAAFYGVDFPLTRSMVEGSLERAKSSDREKTASRSAGGQSTDRQGGSGYSKYECLKISWNEHTPICDRYVVLEEGKCRWIIEANNNCGHDVIVHLLVDRKDGRGPRWVPNVAGGSGHVIEAGWERASHFSSWTKMDLPEHVKPDVRFCVHKWDPQVRRFYDHFRDTTVKDHYRRWYRNDFRDGRVSGEVTRNVSGDFTPNTTCLDTY